MLDKIIFYEGEKREVSSTVHPINTKETAVIARAEFELKKAYDGSIVQNGLCEINGNEAVAFLDFATKGSYELEITSYVGREVIIGKILVEIE